MSNNPCNEINLGSRLHFTTLTFYGRWYHYTLMYSIEKLLSETSNQKADIIEANEVFKEYQKWKLTQC